MIAVGIPWQHEHIPKRFLLDMLRSDLRTGTVIVLGDVGDTAQNRNQIVRRSMLIGASCIYFLDVDQGIPTNIKERFESCGKKIVSALAPHRRGTHMLAFKRIGDKYSPVHPQGMEQVDGVGFGCVRVDMEVFQRIPAPWFENKYDNYGGMILEHDLSFCAKAKKAGYEIWVDGSLGSDHYSTDKVVVRDGWTADQSCDFVPVGGVRCV